MLYYLTGCHAYWVQLLFMIGIMLEADKSRGLVQRGCPVVRCAGTYCASVPVVPTFRCSHFHVAIPSFCVCFAYKD